MTGEPPVEVYNPPGRAALEWRVGAHPHALARMRAALTADDLPTPIRALSQHDTGDPAVAVLDAWALVTDVVSFYTERIANEGYLRTATERTSLRELARTLGHELRPGVAAQADLAFMVEDAPGAPETAVVPRGTPVQTVPGAGQMPQVFETSADLEAHAGWNAIACAPGVRQTRPTPLTTPLWLAGAGLGLRVGDAVLVGDEPDTPRALCTITALAEEPPGRPGWTTIVATPRGGEPDAAELDPAGKSAGPLRVDAIEGRAYLFGWNAPDPALLRGTAPGTPPAPQEWPDFGILEGGFLELDGDHPEVLPDSWLVLEDVVPGQPGQSDPVVRPVIVKATKVLPGAATRYALAGRVTRVVVDGLTAEDIAVFSRRSTVVYVAGRSLPAATAPHTKPVSGTTVELAAVGEPLPPGRVVVVTGWPYDVVPPAPAPAAPPPAPPQVESAQVASASIDPVDAAMKVVLTEALDNTYDPRTLRVYANVVEATHGETVAQVLGSGDGRAGFVRFPLRRGPLTHLRASTATGVRSSLEVRVDGVVWSEVESLADVAGEDRVVAVREEEDGTATVTFGDGAHGARVPSGQENVIATYRVGMGADGAAVPGQLSMLVRRPFGIRSVANPAKASDWAPRETVDQARVTAPTRVRTLDRIVSVADYGDVAQGFAGVGAATATPVWNGQHDVVTVTVLGIDDPSVSPELVSTLVEALDALRDPSAPLDVYPAKVLRFGARLTLQTDPAYRQPDVVDAVRARLDAVFGAGRWGLANPVTGARILVAARSVPGVLDVATMPKLVTVSADGTDGEPVDLIDARAARWDDTTKAVAAAEVAVLDLLHTTIAARS